MTAFYFILHQIPQLFIVIFRTCNATYYLINSRICMRVSTEALQRRKKMISRIYGKFARTEKFSGMYPRVSHFGNPKNWGQVLSIQSGTPQYPTHEFLNVIRKFFDFVCFLALTLMPLKVPKMKQPRLDVWHSIMHH